MYNHYTYHKFSPHVTSEKLGTDPCRTGLISSVEYRLDLNYVEVYVYIVG
jgi:hypothetical protein